MEDAFGSPDSVWRGQPCHNGDVSGKTRTKRLLVASAVFVAGVLIASILWRYAVVAALGAAIYLTMSWIGSGPQKSVYDSEQGNHSKLYDGGQYFGGFGL